LIRLKSSYLVHQYLYANLMELSDIKDLEELQTKQTIVKKEGK
jgi:hypothetical protein